MDSMMGIAWANVSLSDDMLLRSVSVFARLFYPVRKSSAAGPVEQDQGHGELGCAQYDQAR
jgi:hypothetical protein